jgi:hypothetical protein
LCGALRSYLGGEMHLRIRSAWFGALGRNLGREPEELTWFLLVRRRRAEKPRGSVLAGEHDPGADVLSSDLGVVFVNVFWGEYLRLEG